MTNEAWETMHEEKTEASRELAWRCWTDVANWDDRQQDSSWMVRLRWGPAD